MNKSAAAGDGPDEPVGELTTPRRIADDPVEPTDQALDAIVVDGTPLPLRPGETIAACLLGNGRLSWRTTRFGGRPRGVFCGIGICFDCLVTVNGTTGVRACRHTARPGDVVTTGQAEPTEGGLRR